jgi:hypothetical protein
MAATTAGALKALIESLGLGISAYRDEAPAGTARPYCTIIEELVMVADASEDGKAGTVAETCQVDLWQDWHDMTTGGVKESYTLAPAVRRGIDGARIAAIGTAVPYIALVRHSLRLLEPDENLVHTALTVEVRRQA